MFYSYNNISNTIILYPHTHKEGVLRAIVLSSTYSIISYGNILLIWAFLIDAHFLGSPDRG
jgi:hypothetical protein